MSRVRLLASESVCRARASHRRATRTHGSKRSRREERMSARTVDEGRAARRDAARVRSSKRGLPCRAPCADRAPVRNARSHRARRPRKHARAIADSVQIVHRATSVSSEVSAKGHQVRSSRAAQAGPTSRHEVLADGVRSVAERCPRARREPARPRRSSDFKARPCAPDRRVETLSPVGTGTRRRSPRHARRDGPDSSPRPPPKSFRSPSKRSALRARIGAPGTIDPPVRARDDRHGSSRERAVARVRLTRGTEPCEPGQFPVVRVAVGRTPARSDATEVDDARAGFARAAS